MDISYQDLRKAQSIVEDEIRALRRKAIDQLSREHYELLEEALALGAEREKMKSAHRLKCELDRYSGDIDTLLRSAAEEA